MSAGPHISKLLAEAGLGRGTFDDDCRLYLGAVTATDEISLFSAERSAARVIACYLLVSTTHAAHDTNYWTFQLQNKGAAGTGTTDLLSAAQSTKITGGTAITKHVAYDITPNQNQELAIGESLSLVATKVAAATSLDGAVVVCVIRHQF